MPTPRPPVLDKVVLKPGIIMSDGMAQGEVGIIVQDDDANGGDQYQPHIVKWPSRSELCRLSESNVQCPLA